MGWSNDNLDSEFTDYLTHNYPRHNSHNQRQLVPRHGEIVLQIKTTKHSGFLYNFTTNDATHGSSIQSCLSMSGVA